jgi:DNA-binding transcriptional ArsR family regulator
MDTPRPATKREITDVRVIAALAHPVRVQLLGHLMANGARTATECAAVVDASPSACSYHLRHLERFGLVERDDTVASDGRERRWRTTATGFSFGGQPSTDKPAMAAARHAQRAASIDESARLAHRFVANADSLSDEWRDAAGFATFGLLVSPSELAEVMSKVDAVIRPYIGLTRRDAPADAAAVHVSVQAFRRIET